MGTGFEQMMSAKTTLKSAAVLAAVLILVAGCGRKNDVQLTTRTPNLEVRQADAAEKAAEEGGEEARKRKEPKDTPFILDPLIK
jgi:predicted small lipoprotein YifL